MNRIAITLTLTGLVVCTAAPAQAAVPGTMSFTARISDASGPITGAISLNVKIFDASTMGTMVWEESHTLTATGGLLFAELGSTGGNGLDSTVFTGADRWIELTINGTAMSPRLKVASVPYAVHAAQADNATSATNASNADNLGGVAASGWQRRVTGTCPTGQSISGINSSGGVTCTDTRPTCTWSGTRWLSSGYDGGCAFSSGVRVTCTAGRVTAMVHSDGCGAVP